MGKFIAAEYVLITQDKNLSDWRGCVINKRSMEDVTMRQVRGVTE
jgi:hypothetical protein